MFDLMYSIIDRSSRKGMRSFVLRGNDILFRGASPKRCLEGLVEHWLCVKLREWYRGGRVRSVAVKAAFSVEECNSWQKWNQLIVL